MKKIIFFFLLTSLSFSQNFTLSGTIKDNTNNETIIGATLVIIENNAQITTNSYGYFSLSLPKGNYTYQVIKNGYQLVENSISLEKDEKIDLKLEKENDVVLDEVRIEKNRGKINLKKPELSTHALEIDQIKKMPVLLGEVDVLKALTFLPGVTNGGEVSSGINVRGGAVDQNLVLLDEATIFNTSHLFGFFSIFNPDAIKDLKLFKGGIPARYGGRVSSVLDIYLKDGNNKNYQVNGGIGLLSSRLLIEGPIQKEKSSFLVGGRSSYAHLFIPLFDKENTNKAYFYDLNTKLSFTIDDKNSLFLSGYFGRDVFQLSKSFINTYGNSIANVRWNHLFSDKLFSNLSLIYSDYYYGLTIDAIGFDWNSGIQNLNLKYDFKHFLSNKVKMNYGLQSIYHAFNPGIIKPNSPDSEINYEELYKKIALENAVYFDVEHELSEKFSVEYGLRWSNFLNIGKQFVNIYENNQPVLYDANLEVYKNVKPIAVEEYASGKVIKSFNNLEPRLSLAYQFSKNESVKAGYNRMAQYLHLLSNTNAPTPLDVWTPSGKYIKPQLLDQISVGYFRNIKNTAYSLEVESFYKTIQNRIDYTDGADLIANNEIETVILNGQARAYGLELMLKKNKGKLTGWISYTLSNSEQRTKGINKNEVGINNGNWYATPYNRTHNVAITSNYKLNEKWSFSANFTYLSGMHTTFPNGQYVYQESTIALYNPRNSDKLRDFHHLDISATLNSRKNKNRKWKSEWVFGIYNLYNRRNPTFIFFERDEEKGNQTKQLSIFGAIPSVTYNFKF
jgi:hypothetical protein